MNIPVKMKAMVLTNPGKWEITEADVPTPGPEEVLCRIDAVAICGSDPEIIHGGLAGIWPPSGPSAGGVTSRFWGLSPAELSFRLAPSAPPLAASAGSPAGPARSS